MKIAIVIPVYRKPTELEIVSLRQCCKVLSHYDHYLVVPEDLDTTPFHFLWSEYGLTLFEERFASKFFEGLYGYNRLCLSREYYARFNGGGIRTCLYINQMRLYLKTMWNNGVQKATNMLVHPMWD